MPSFTKSPKSPKSPIKNKIDLKKKESNRDTPEMSFVKISAKRMIRDDKGKKKVQPRFPTWKNDEGKTKTKAEYADMFNPSDKVIMILTGKINDITVFDFDKEGTYEECIEKHPELKEAYTVKTQKGYHIYTKYNSKYKTTANTERGIDIRNDDALVFGNMTKTEYGFTYKILDNEKRLDLEMPQSFYETITPPIKKAKKTPRKIKLKTPKLVDEETPPNTELLFAKKVINIISPKIIDEMNNFRRIVWAMKNEGFSIEDVEDVAKKSQHYDKKTYTKWFAETKLWDSKTNKNGCKIGTLIHFAKLSDEKAFYDLYIKERTDFSDDGIYKSDVILAQTYLDILGDNIFYQDKKLYIFLKNEWWCDKEGHFVKRNFYEEMGQLYKRMKWETNKQINLIESQAKEKLTDKEKEERDDLLNIIKEINGAITHINKVNTLNNVLSALKTLLATLKEEIIFDTCEEQIYNIHFKNGCFDLNTNTFRPRTKDDYVSMYLSWDYEPEIITEEAREEVAENFRKIEPCDVRRRCLLSYLAYSLTGDTGKQKYINLIGYTAANGKSATFKMMDRCFEFYTKKLPSNIFNVGNEQRHKDLIHLYQNPVRFAYIEELDNKKKLDAEYMKDCIDGDKVPVKVMYGTSVDINIQAKFITSSNGDVNIKMDEAILRRIVNLYLHSQFVDGLEEDDWENRKFVRKNGMEKRYDCPIMKNAVFELLTRPEYKEFVVPESVKADTKDTADLLNDFRDKFEEHYNITKNPEDFINKNDFLDTMKISKTDLKKTITELGLLGIKYHKDKKKNNVRGCFSGLRENTKPCLVEVPQSP